MRGDGVFVPQIGVGLCLCDAAVLMQVRSWPQECVGGMTGVMML